MPKMIVKAVPMHNDLLPYPVEYHHVVELDEDDYTSDELGDVLLGAIQKAHTHPEGPAWFRYFQVSFEKV